MVFFKKIQNEFKKSSSVVAIEGLGYRINEINEINEFNEFIEINIVVSVP